MCTFIGYSALDCVTYPGVDLEQDEELDSDDEEGLENVCVSVEERRCGESQTVHRSEGASIEDASKNP